MRLAKKYFHLKSNAVYNSSAKNRVNCHIIEISEFCLKIYDLWRYPHLWVGVWVDGWVIVWVSGWSLVKSLNIK